MCTMLSFNLLNTCFRPEIQCKSPTVDGYEISNLFEQSGLFGRIGFLAESFIKPPVDVKLTFPCRINLHKILLDTKVGAQRSTGFEIFSYSEKRKFKPKNDTPIFSVIGRGTSDKTLFCFINNRFSQFFVPKRNIPKFQTVSNIEQLNRDGKSLIVFELTNRRDDLLCDVTDITIRIRSVASGSVCALKAIEVWGYPSRYVSEAVLHGLGGANELNQAEHVSNVVIQNTLQEECIFENPEKPSNARDGVSVPDDFLDALTLELMAMPILLPSGYSIDQSSLERHSLEQANWGRVSSDPFTFKPFTKAYQPVLNVTLKVRIDEFLLRNPQLEVSNRTVGRVHKYASSKIIPSSLVKDSTSADNEKKRKHIPTSTSGSSVATQRNCTEMSLSQTPRKRQKFDQSVTLKPSSTVTSETSSRELSTDSCVHNYRCATNVARTDMMGNHGTTSSLKTNACVLRNHSTASTVTASTGMMDNHGNTSTPTGTIFPDRHTQLTSSLDSALSSVLGNLPSYSNIVSSSSCTETNEGAPDIQGCVECRTKSIAILYKLVCDHFICRPCLLLKKSDYVLCSLCHQTSLKKNVIKVHG